MQPLEDEIPRRFKVCGAYDCRVHFAIDKNASVACLCAEASGKIDHRPDRGVVAAPSKLGRASHIRALFQRQTQAYGRRRAIGRIAP